MKKRTNIVIFHPYSGFGGADRSIARVINNLDEKIFNIHFISITKPNIKIFLKKKILFHKINSSRVLFSIFKIRKILKSEFNNDEKNILVSNQNFANILSFMILFGFNNFKQILIERNSLKELNYSKNFFDYIKKLIIKLLIKILYRYSDLVICISKRLTKEIKDFTSANTKTIYNPALDNSIFFKKNKINKFKLKKNTIINVGRLEIQKDQITLIKAFKLIKNKKNFNLIIVGYGSCYGKLMSFIKNNNLQNKVKIIKKIKNVNFLIKNSKLFVLSSKYEGFANVLIEAGINNTPIISSSCYHGPIEILKKGRYGDMFNVGDYKKLSIKIQKFIDNPKELIQKSKKFRKSLNRFDTKKIIYEYKKSLINV